MKNSAKQTWGWARRNALKAALLSTALLFGLAACGGGGGGSSGGGAAPEMTVTPVTENPPDTGGISVRVTDTHDDNLNIQYKLFFLSDDTAPYDSSTRVGTAPSASSHWNSRGLNQPSTHVYSCSTDQGDIARSVCWGGQSSDRSRSYGAGYSGREACTGCCARCPSSGTQGSVVFASGAGSAPPTTPPPASGNPDLDVRSFTVSDTTPDAGERITLSASVYNYGPGASPRTTLRYYRSTNSTITSSDTEVGTDSVGVLMARETDPESVRVNAPPSGTYYYGACVDRVSGESDPSDDCTSSSEAVRVVVSGASPPPTSGSGTITFTLTDRCTRPGAVQARFFGYVGTSTAGSPDFVWPSSSRVYTTDNRRTTGDSITQTLGESGRGIGVICYGAQLENTPTSFWGVGLDGDQSCSSCCIQVPSSGNSRREIDLRC